MSTLGTARVIRGDARRLPLADDSVDLIVTSPPYFALRSYQDAGEHYDGQIGSEPTPTEFVDALLEVTRECMRVLRPTGSLWVNLGDKYAASRRGPDGTASTLSTGPQQRAAHTARYDVPRKSLLGIPWRYALRCVDELGLVLRAEVVWSKPNGLPESVSDRVRRSHEQWFHFTLGPRYFAAVDEIREPHTWQPSAGYRGHAARVVDGQPVHAFANGVEGNPMGKLPGSVWTVPLEPLNVPAHLGVDHFAAFPSEWPKRIVQGWSPTGVCVECGEGRRPVCEDDPAYVAFRAEHGDFNAANYEAGVGYSGSSGAKHAARASAVPPQLRRITGYTCGCNDVIASPTGRAGAADPSRETGRAGLNRPRGDAEGVRPITRWEQRHEAAQLRDSPHRAAMATEAGTAFAHYVRTDRSGARPIPEALRQQWRDRGWLEPPPPFDPPETRPAVVLDPFGGTGTTAMVAKALGRDGISVDMSSDYCRIAEWRTNDRDQLAKVLGIAKAEQQPEDQTDIFDLLEEGA